MNYAARIKLNLMKGKAFNIRGQGIGGMGALPRMRLNDNTRRTGTISHRAVVGALEPLMEQLNITKATPKKKITSGKSGGGAKKTNYKSLKFNF